MIKLTNYNTFQADVLSHGLEYAVRHSVDLGFDAVEFLDTCRMGDSILPTLGEAKDVKALLDRYGLGVSCYSVGVQLLCDDPTATEKALFAHIDFAAAIGSKLFHHTIVPVLTLPADAPSYEDVMQKILPYAEHIASYCTSRGLTCLYEPQGMYFNGIQGLKPFLAKMKQAGHRVGLCGDFGNSLFVDVAPDAIFDEFIGDIKHVHVKDYLVSDTEIDGKHTDFCSKGGRWIYEADMGEGSVKLDRCFDALRAVNYDGAVSFEFVADDETNKKAMQLVREKLGIL
ncbi:MAG: sugar phosphate isomerase/epimerase [Clostridia bacterium]|nr:sugar phosphate isomerase/epimerase [Clostridia bacterium]